MPDRETAATVDYRGHALHGRRVTVVSEPYAAVLRGVSLGRLVDVDTDDGGRYALPEAAVRRTRRDAA